MEQSTEPYKEEFGGTIDGTFEGGVWWDDQRNIRWSIQWNNRWKVRRKHLEDPRDQTDVQVELLDLLVLAYLVTSSISAIADGTSIAQSKAVSVPETNTIKRDLW